MVCKEGQQTGIELKLIWHLVPYLVNTVQKLYEYGATLTHVSIAVNTASFSEHVTECQKIFIYQHLEPLYSPVVRIYHQLSESTHLRSAVPPVRAVNDHTVGVHIQRPENLVD